MNNKRPQNILEYKTWLKDHHNISVTEKSENHYISVTNKIKSDLSKSPFWNFLGDNLGEYGVQYLMDTGYPLLSQTIKPEIHTKPFDSFFLKTFRKNVLENKHWPEPPEIGWILPGNWFMKINDIIRTLIIVKYLDGVSFLVEKIKSVCGEYNQICSEQWEAKEEGYYAVHLYTKQDFEIPKLTWDTERINISFEIQISTELQANIRSMLHKYYEKRRKVKLEEDIKWQWNYNSDEFLANYLGHILHSVEGMIMEIREKQKKELK